MNSSYLKRLIAAGTLGVLLALAGGIVLYASSSYVDQLRQDQRQALQSRIQAEERLQRVRVEGQEIDSRVNTYVRLASAGIIGEERRLEWIEALERIRADDESRTVHYTIDPQKTLNLGVPGTADVAVRSSLLKLSASLLHEERFFDLLNEVRTVLPAHTLVRSCTLQRQATSNPNAGIYADCVLDLITISDQGQRKDGK